jgi:hypothetical protein
MGMLKRDLAWFSDGNAAQNPFNLPLMFIAFICLRKVPEGLVALKHTASSPLIAYQTC